MNFFKIFKALNGAQSSWQISMAVVFGMLSGFLPLLTLINFFIIVIVFTLNIPIAIFILSSALFASLALFLDPTFASIGYDILTNTSYSSLFTSMYNYAPTLWSSFNHTVVMGSFIISIILFIPLFFIFKIIINKYRISFEKWFKDSKYFSFLNPFTQKKLNKKPGIFRWWGAALILGITALILAIVLLLIDPVLKFTLEFALSKASKKEIYIKSLNSSFANGTLNINEIIIKSNKSNNDNKIGQIKLNIDVKKLLHKNVSINSLIFKDIILKTSIDTNNKINASKIVNKAVKDLKSSNSKSSLKVNMPSVDEILEKENLQSLNKAKQIKKDINKIYEKYKNFDKSQFDKEKLKLLKQRALKLAKDAKNIKDVSQVQNIIDEAKAIKNEISILNDKIKKIKDEYEKDQKLLKEHLNTIKTLPKEEFDYLKNKYSLNQSGALNFVSTYISKDLKVYIMQALKYYKIIKPYIASEDKELSVEQKRLKGRYIHFKQKNPYPSFVLKDLNGNATLNTLNFSFKANDISNNQKIYKKEIKGYIQGDDKNYKKAKITFVHNGLNDIAVTTINSLISEFKSKDLKVHKQINLSHPILNAKSSIKIKEFKSIQASINSNFSNTNINYNAKKSKTNEIIKSILSNIHSFDVNSKINGSLKNPSISINSNLDKKIASGLKNRFNKELNKFKIKLKTKLQAKFKKELRSNISDDEFKNIQELISSFSKDNSSVTQSIKEYLNKDSLVEKIKNKAKNKAKEKVKEKAKDALKDKFKSLF